MTEISNNTASSGNSGLYFIVGGLVVAVAIGAFAYSGGYFGGSKTTTERTTTSVPGIGSVTTTTTTDKK